MTGGTGESGDDEPTSAGEPDGAGEAGARKAEQAAKAEAALLARRITRKLPTRGPGLLARAGHLEYDRILFFSDAIFAIAITLLIVDLPVQLEHVRGHDITASAQLRGSVSGIIGFGISFAVIGLFWVGHHGLFRFVRAFDRRLMLLNLLFLGIIAFLPFPTELLSSVSSNQAPAVVFYATCAGTAGLVETAVWLYATRHGLVTGLTARQSRMVLLQTARGPAVFAFSILIAQFSARLATYSWTLIWLAALVIEQAYGPFDPADTEDPVDEMGTSPADQ